MADDLDDVPGIDDPDEFHTVADAVLQYLQEKLLMLPEDFDQLSDEARRRAFTVAGVADLDVMADVLEAVDSAVRNGESMEDFRERVGEKLESAWGAEDPSRVETIFRTEVQGAYSAGRQYQNAQVRETHPYVRFDVVDDEATSDICEALIGVVVEADSDFAATHQPPLHPRCRTDLVAVTEDEARELGVDEADDVEAEASDGFGAGWDPDWEPDVSSRPPDLASIYEMKVLQ